MTGAQRLILQVCGRVMRNYATSMRNDKSDDGQEASYRRGLRNVLEFMKWDGLINEYEFGRGIQFSYNGIWHDYKTG